MKIEKLWGERFETVAPKEIIQFLSGRDVRGVSPCDERLVPYDIWGSRAHTVMLWRQKIITEGDASKILEGLAEVERLFKNGKFRLDTSREDVHSFIESFLVDRLGIEYGGKLHTGRSRNDQIALDMRLYLRDEVLDFVESCTDLLEILSEQGSEHRLTLMPGYTHHQHATVTTFGHLLLAFCEGIDRDIQRFMQWFILFNKNPLGSMAGYGTSFPLDRKLTSRLLGFDGPTGNTLDPVTQRWEPEAELAYAIAVTMNHLSTIAQTLILFCTDEFGFVRLDDRHCTGSSILPQKRNPDTLEVVKAKASFAHGVLSSLLSCGKGLLAGYNRESQWTKYWIMDLIDETKPAISVMTDVIRSIEVRRDRMYELAQRDFVCATFLMEWIARTCCLPIRIAKSAVERAVKYAEKEHIDRITGPVLRRALQEMGVTLSSSDDEIEKVQRPEEVLKGYRTTGMPSGRALQEEFEVLREKIGAYRMWHRKRRRELERAKGTLKKMEDRLISG